MEFLSPVPLLSFINLMFWFNYVLSDLVTELIEKILSFYFLVNLSAHLYQFASCVVFDKVK